MHRGPFVGGVGRGARIGPGGNSAITCDHKKLSWPVGGGHVAQHPIGGRFLRTGEIGNAVEQRDPAGGRRWRAGDSPALHRPLRFSYGWPGWLRCRTAMPPAVISRASVAMIPAPIAASPQSKPLSGALSVGAGAATGLAPVLTSALLWRPLGGTWLASACSFETLDRRELRGRGGCGIGGTARAALRSLLVGVGMHLGTGARGLRLRRCHRYGVPRGRVDVVRPLLWPEVKPCRGRRRGDRSDREGACDDGAAYCESHDSSCG